MKAFAERHSLGRNFVYELCAQGKLRAIKVGGKWLVASDALDLIAAGVTPNGAHDD